MLKIGIGAGLKYHVSVRRRKGGSPPIEDITDAILLSDGQGVILLSDGSYLAFKEEAVQSRTTRTSKKVNKSYWNF